ncbi:FAD:protein FMN transferase [Thiohalorhabdus sp. Cl-TMA]|uniref:FAD:protein FMN transferase n=1 Tax=Thiohalorhabdus methylotrophus TaxID=3242694 RepID=A0ABV4TQ45_9GAMM
MIPSKGRFPRLRAFAALLLAILALTACDRAPEARQDQAFVLGTLVEITAVGMEKEAFHAAAGAAFREMRRIHDALGPTDEDSALAAFNRAERGEWTPLDGPLSALLPRALSVQRASANAFNPHLGRLVALWGFRAPPFPEAPPAGEAVDALLDQGAGDRALALRRHDALLARLTRPGAALDLGGIAKGYAVDRATAVLAAHGVENALINAGGDLRALGSHGGRPWRVGIRNPRDRDRVLAVVPLHDGEAIVTSGDYERFFRHEGRRYHHLLDPATGAPARAARQATVLGPRATEADAWSTALFVAGAPGFQRLGKEQPALVIDTAGKAHASPAMKARLDWRSEEVAAP